MKSEVPKQLGPSILGGQVSANIPFRNIATTEKVGVES
jgi:hypothetical protein